MTPCHQEQRSDYFIPYRITDILILFLLKVKRISSGDLVFCGHLL